MFHTIHKCTTVYRLFNIGATIFCCRNVNFAWEKLRFTLRKNLKGNYRKEVVPQNLKQRRTETNADARHGKMFRIVVDITGVFQCKADVFKYAQVFFQAKSVGKTLIVFI